MLHDQFSDKSFRVLAQKLKEFPASTTDLIKSAEIDYDEVDSLPETAFAWPELRKFAVHTPEHAALSRIYSTGEEIPGHVKQAMDRALDIYGIEFAPSEKVAEEVTESLDDYLVPQLRFGKMTDATSVKEAARNFSDVCKKMDLETRVHAAGALVKKAQDYQVKIPPAIYKHAGLTCCNRKVMGEWIEVRKDLSEGQTKVAFEKLHAYVSDKKAPIEGRPDLLKIADTLFELDKKANLVGKYDRTLPDPMATVFNMSKIAEETLTLAGKTIPSSTLLGLSKETYGDLLGGDVISEITDKAGALDKQSLFALLKTLPADMQMILVKNLGL